MAARLGSAGVALRSAAMNAGAVRGLAAAATEGGNAAEARSLYRRFLRAANGFGDYNLREYTKRRAGEEFRAHADAPSDKIATLLTRGANELEVIERQAAISKLFKHVNSVMDLPSKKRME
ncbi:LYR motif-containing protein 4 [Hondaea fermentalgiana]|uniref:LYR motif-containing protein 4 n=1 Tax=Hondaea fermentalgiana TaxID=2315210 RepID=A0A2R5GSY5_9STRA|nr:LYR motif-containing protein 4 [Hondaea fermentalgiana]|eukprot:GBG31491.1 LYR motif-containing protein 4 [Hondaea fermentalgiana]